MIDSSLSEGRRLFRRAASFVLWYGVPALALVAVVAYILGATVGHANPPVVPVEGLSMRPTLQGGDLVVLKGVNPATLRKGDIIAVKVPKTARDQYSLPGEIVHRIVRIGHDSGGLFFITKGDANHGADVFQTRPGDVVGELELDLPAAGYPLLFFRSRQGEIFLGVAGLIVLCYFALGLFEERRAYVEGSVLTMQTVLREAQRDDATLHELVEATAEYGRHLRSHTEVMKNLAATTAELRLVVSGLAVRETEAPRSSLDRLIEETGALVAQTSQRREELRRSIIERDA